MAKNYTPQDFDVTRASDIVLTNVEYFWHDRIPFGQIVLCAGRQGGGKSTIVSDIAAHVTRDLKHGVLMSNQEDAASVVRARLQAAGADLDKVFVPPVEYKFPADVNLLALHIAANGCKVAIFDTAAQHLACNMNNDQDVRTAMSPLAKLADATGCCIIFVTHVTKHVSKNAYPLSAIGGSGGITGAARSAFFVGPNPENITERAVVWVKDQYRPMPQGMTFEVEACTITDATGNVEANTQVCILTAEDVDIDPMSVLSGKARSDDGNGPTADKRAGAAEWLTVYLSTGKQGATEVQNDGRQAGHSWASIRRGAEDVGIEKYREGFGKGSKLFWALPDGHPSLVTEQAIEDDTPTEEEVEAALAAEDIELTDDDVAKLLGGTP